jgi:hypothetical protein
MSLASKGSFGWSPPTGTPIQRSTSPVSSCVNWIAVSLMVSSVDSSKIVQLYGTARAESKRPQR